MGAEKSPTRQLNGGMSVKVVLSPVSGALELYSRMKQGELYITVGPGHRSNPRKSSLHPTQCDSP